VILAYSLITTPRFASTSGDKTMTSGLTSYNTLTLHIATPYNIVLPVCYTRNKSYTNIFA